MVAKLNEVVVIACIYVDSTTPKGIEVLISNAEKAVDNALEKPSVSSIRLDH